MMTVKPILHRELFAALTDVIGIIPGGVLLGETPSPGAENGGPATIHVHGWGPGLHHLSMRWEVELPAARIPRLPIASHLARRRLRRDVAQALQPHLQRQLARAERGSRLFFGRPRHRPKDAATAAAHPDNSWIRHLLIDRQILTMIVDHIARHDGSADRFSVVRQLCFDAATAHEGYEGDGREIFGTNLIRKTTSRISEIRLADGSTGSILRPTHILSADPAVTFDGSVVAAVAAIPETMLTLLDAAAGRPLGELLATGTPLDARPVVKAISAESGFGIAVRPDPVRIADLPDAPMTAADVAAMPSISIPA